MSVRRASRMRDFNGAHPAWLEAPLIRIRQLPCGKSRSSTLFFSDDDSAEYGKMLRSTFCSVLCAFVTCLLPILDSLLVLAPPMSKGTILASVTAVTKALIETPSAISLDLVPRAILGLVSLLLGNAFIVGINQIYDMDIDKINKPYLPVASGEISERAAWVLVFGSLMAGPLIVYKSFSPLIFRLYSFGLLIGGLYSVPPFSFKRFPVVAGLTIACVRGFLLNFGVYHAVREALGLGFKWNPAVLFLARFMTVFAGVIAVTKDLPDVKGDREYNISTFASKMGVAWTARMACAVLALNYVSAIVQGVLSPAGSFNKKIMVGGHSLLLIGLGAALRKLVPDSQESIKAFYKRIWDLFYLEYALYPFI